jgi:hypothetical protein
LLALPPEGYAAAVGRHWPDGGWAAYADHAWKVERNYFDKHVLAPGTYRPLLIEGLEQAGDTRLPEVSIHRQFRCWWKTNWIRSARPACDWWRTVGFRFHNWRRGQP